MTADQTDSFLPARVECPNCKAMLELDGLERSKRKVTCPECKTTTDFNSISIEQMQASVTFQTFRQSRWLFMKHEDTLKEKELFVQESSLLNRRSYSVPFEVIPDQFVEVAVSSQWALVLLSITAVVGISKLLAGEEAHYFFAALLFGIWFWVSHVTYLVYNCGDLSFALFKDSPSEESVREFVEELKDEKHKYLRETYVGTQTGNLVDELHKLAWLKDNGALTQEEFDRLKASLLDEINKPKRQIGFTDS